MKTPRLVAKANDLESGVGRFYGEDDNSKSKRPIFIVRWRQYSRGIYTIGLVLTTLYLLYIGIVYVSNQEHSFHSVQSYSPPKQTTFKMMVVADLDKKSKVEDNKKGKWRSLLKKAELRCDENGVYSVSWLEDQEIFTKFSEADRGMELSALLNFQNHLYAFDDRTGLVFELVKGNRAIPRYILMEGDGNTDKGQKTEWATVKDGKMYVGSFGKEYTNPDGSIKNTNNMWVSIIDENGVITHEDWIHRFNKLREAAGCAYPGYMIHEAITWSPVRKQWVVLPRRVSKEAYNEDEDERRGSNTILLASEDFSKIEVRHITPLTPTRGFSEFKFLPGSNDNIIVAMKSEENEEKQTQNTYVTIFTLDGEVLMEETEIPGNHKFEGLEFFYFSSVC